MHFQEQTYGSTKEKSVEEQSPDAVPFASPSLRGDDHVPAVRRTGSAPSRLWRVRHLSWTASFDRFGRRVVA